MNGLQMMLKSFGVDPDIIIGNIEKMKELVENIDARLSAIQEQNTRILERLDNAEHERNKHGTGNGQETGTESGNKSRSGSKGNAFAQVAGNSGETD